MADLKIEVISQTIRGKTRILKDEWTIGEDEDDDEVSVTKDAFDYLGGQSQFEEFKSTGYTVVAILPILIGKPWNNIALGYIHSVRPTSIRVVRTNQPIKLDCRTWRVTVHINDDDIIESITQEVSVGLPDGCKHGHHLEISLDAGEIVEYDDDISYIYAPYIPEELQNLLK